MGNNFDVKEIMEEESNLKFVMPEQPYKQIMRTKSPSSSLAKRRSDEIYGMIRQVVSMAQNLEESGADETTMNQYYLLYADLITIYQKEINTSLDNIIDDCV